MAGSAPVLTAVCDALQELPWANPSSLHREGQQARAKFDQARDLAALVLGVPSRSIVFCASGTEAVNLALIGAARRLRGRRRIVTWAAEHQAVLAATRWLEAEGFPVSVLPVDADARAQPEGIPDDAGLVSVGLANNEVGTIQPVREIATRAHELGALVHLDCCQGPAWIAVPTDTCDLASFSGHKLGAGRGGMLYAAAALRVDPLLHGGPQEWGRRAGREDVEAAVALSAALSASAQARDVQAQRLRPLSDRLRAELAGLGGRLTGGAPRLPNFASAAFRSRKGEDLLLALDFEGVAASSGSACASGSLDPSHVLLAMGLSLEESLGSLRLTLGYDTTEADVELAAAALHKVLAPRHTGAGASVS